jgi:hypothetical protein
MVGFFILSMHFHKTFETPHKISYVGWWIFWLYPQTYWAPYPEMHHYYDWAMALNFNPY